jgi:rod shape-determining protein MreB
LAKARERGVFKRLSGIFGHDVGLDLGTSNVVVYVKGKGIFIDEPSVVSYRQGSKGKREVIAIGRRAKSMMGKTPAGIETIRPLQHGVIADFEATEAMIWHFIRTANGGRRFLAHPKVVACVPACGTEVERRAVVDAALAAGAREAYVVEEPVAAAIGAGLPINEPRGNMVVDIGGGTSEVAVLSLGGIVVSDSVRIAGDDIDEAIVNLLRQEKKLYIGNITAEEIKVQIGSAYPLDEELEMEVKGRDLTNGLPRAVKITSGEVRESLEPILLRIEEKIRETLERTQPELARDIVEHGIVLSGGGSLLRELPRRLSASLEIPVILAEQPLYSVAIGLGRILERLDFMKRALVSVEGENA